MKKKKCKCKVCKIMKKLNIFSYSYWDGDDFKDEYFFAPKKEEPSLKDFNKAIEKAVKKTKKGKYTATQCVRKLNDQIEKAGFVHINQYHHYHGYIDEVPPKPKGVKIKLTSKAW